VKIEDIIEFLTLYELQRISKGIVEVKSFHDILAVYNVYVMFYTLWEKRLRYLDSA